MAARLLVSGRLAAFVEGARGGTLADSSTLAQLACNAMLAIQQAAAAAQEAGAGSSVAGAQLQPIVAASQQLEAAMGSLKDTDRLSIAKLAPLRHALLPAFELAVALEAYWQAEDASQERQQAARLELAQAAAARQSCAHLACPNLEATGKRGRRCSGCNTARYCSHACSAADWRAGHRRACKLLAAAREAAMGQ